SDSRVQRIVDINDNQAMRSSYVGIVSGNGDVVRISERATRIESAVGILRWIKCALQIVVERIAVQQRGGINQDQAFIFIGNVQIRKQWMDGLLFVDQLSPRSAREPRRARRID